MTRKNRNRPPLTPPFPEQRATAPTGDESAEPDQVVDQYLGAPWGAPPVDVVVEVDWDVLDAEEQAR